MPLWLAALGATLLMQTVATFLGQVLPVVAPLLLADAGLRGESIGLLTGLTAFGTVAALLVGGPLLLRHGPVRALQGGALVSGAGLLLAGFGVLPALMVSALLIGIGYGPSAPAGSRILAATAPKGRRTLIFSIKQSGAMLGGGLAGLLAPWAAGWGGWPAALWLGAGIAFAAACAIQPLRARLDEERDPGARANLALLFSRANLAAPLRALSLAPGLWPTTLLGTSFAVVQGCLFAFSVSWLVAGHGLSLAAAGGAFAAMQGAAMVARIALAMLADRTGRAARNLVAQAVLAALAVAGFALLPPGAPYGAVLALSALCGAFCASWNGIVLAEVARLVPQSRIAEATSGSTLVVFLGYTLGPAAFAAVAAASGSWRSAMLLVAAQVLAAAALLAPALLRNSRG